MNIEEGILKLVTLAERKGYLTYDDINAKFSGSITPEDLDEIHTKLHNLGIEIIDRPLGDNRDSRS